MNYTGLKHETARSKNSSGEPIRAKHKFRDITQPSADTVDPVAIQNIIQVVTNGYRPVELIDEINAGISTMGNRAFLQFVDGLYQQRQHMDTHGIATKCIQGLGRPLTHLNKIQRAFGHHDISAMREHTGPEAETTLKSLGAKGFSCNGHVAFADSPDLYTQAHEAAHGVQQAGLGDSLQLKGDIGEAGDQYEKHADAVAGKVMRGESAESLLDQVAGKATKVSAGPVTDDTPAQMMLDIDKLDCLVKWILDKKEPPSQWSMTARRLYNVELDKEDIAYITTKVQFTQLTPDLPIHKEQGVNSKSLVPMEKEASPLTTEMQVMDAKQQEAAMGGAPVKRILSEEGFEQFTAWILENDIRALFFGDSHKTPDTMLPVEVVKILADTGMLHSVMIEYADNKDDAETEKIHEDFITRIGLKEAKTLQDIKMEQDAHKDLWHIMQIRYILYQKGIPCRAFGSPRHQNTRETLKKSLSKVPPGEVILVMIGPYHLYPLEIVGHNYHNLPQNAFGLLTQVYQPKK